MFGRRKLAMLVAEFLGTGVLTLVFLSVQRSTIGVPYFVALAAGLAVAMAMLVVGEVSGAHLNPAITIALWVARKVGTVTGIVYVIMQLLGAWAAYGLYTYFVNSSLQPIGGHYVGRVFVAEIVGSFILAVGWGAVAFGRVLSNGARAATVGVSYALGIIVAAAAGIGISNPAVALGTRAWEIWGSMGWGTYVAGPVIGALAGAVVVYGLLFRPMEEAEVVASDKAVATPIAAKTASKTARTKTATATTARKKTTTTRRKK
ncbi:MAG TPA: aquaporin [Candidatus Saccharimonadales bacterium]|nr:aquaporin [Candidatus Saccharimonadales bacterium]